MIRINNERIIEIETYQAEVTSLVEKFALLCSQSDGFLKKEEILKLQEQITTLEEKLNFVPQKGKSVNCSMSIYTEPKLLVKSYVDRINDVVQRGVGLGLFILTDDDACKENVIPRANLDEIYEKLIHARDELIFLKSKRLILFAKSRINKAKRLRDSLKRQYEAHILIEGIRLTKINYPPKHLEEVISLGEGLRLVLLVFKNRLEMALRINQNVLTLNLASKRAEVFREAAEHIKTLEFNADLPKRSEEINAINQERDADMKATEEKVDRIFADMDKSYKE